MIKYKNNKTTKCKFLYWKSFCILLHLDCICSVCILLISILSHLYFFIFVFWHFCILYFYIWPIYFLPFCILLYLYFGAFAFRHIRLLLLWILSKMRLVIFVMFVFRYFCIFSLLYFVSILFLFVFCSVQKTLQKMFPSSFVVLV